MSDASPEPTLTRSLYRISGKVEEVLRTRTLEDRVPMCDAFLTLFASTAARLCGARKVAEMLYRLADSFAVWPSSDIDTLALLPKPKPPSRVSRRSASRLPIWLSGFTGGLLTALLLGMGA